MTERRLDVIMGGYQAMRINLDKSDQQGDMKYQH